MPTIINTASALKCAEIYIQIETGLLAYQCVPCGQLFKSHSECVSHVRSCLNLSNSSQHSIKIDTATEKGEDGRLLQTDGISKSGEIQEGDNNLENSLSSIEIKCEHACTAPIVENDEAEGESSNEDQAKEDESFDIKKKPKQWLSDEEKFTRLILKALKRNKQPSDKNILQCDICGVWATSRSLLWRHMNRKHTGNTPIRLKKFCCEFCGIRMTEMGNLIVHKRIHTGEKPFACKFESCEYRFSTSTERQMHMRRHLGEKPYTCEKCPQKFVNKNQLNMHIRMRHSNERPYKCRTCSRSYKDPASLKEHIRSHTGERPFPCDMCGKSFRRYNAMQVHRNIHTDNRPFKCNHCDRGFHSPAARRSHEKIFHKIP